MINIISLIFLSRTMLLICLAMILNACVHDPHLLEQKNGKTQFIYKVPNSYKSIKVWTYIPQNLSIDEAKKAPVVFVSHGVLRNGWNYREQWINHADRYGFALVVPEFSSTQFPNSSSYNFGNIRKYNGVIRPKTQWSFSLIEPIFSQYKILSGTSRETYSFYGHSAGSQFVSRTLTFVDSPNLCLAIAANAGSYTFLDKGIKFPYGLAESPINDQGITRFLAKPLVILLGDQDKDINSAYLPSSAAAMRQGSHRLARGQHFFKNAQTLAAQKNVAFNWQLQLVEGVGHSNTGMAPYAATLINAKRKHCP